MNNAIEGKKLFGRKERYKEGIGEIIDMASHLILPAKLQDWGFEDNSKTKSQTLVWKLFL